MKKNIGPQFLIVSSILILVGVVFIGFKNYVSGDKLFNLGYLGALAIFSLLILIKGIRDFKIQKNSNIQDSKVLNTTTKILGIGLFGFFALCLFCLIVLFLFLSHGFGWSPF